MYAVENVALRVFIVLCLVASVVVVLYFTPIPDKYTKSCDRQCNEFDWPMICRYKFTIEKSSPVNSYCEKCYNNTQTCDQTCSKSIYTVNQQLPGPPIHVCHNDIVLIDVTNRIPGRSLSLHFRGQSHEEAPFMDGVPMVTQCPITSYTTFQYKFRASAVGTHTYSAHSGSLSANGIFGGFVVRPSVRLETNKKLFDRDEKEHLLLLSEWLPGFVTDFENHNEEPTDILINGKLKQEGLTFSVIKGKRYRFRVAYAATVFGCTINLSVDKHSLNVISVDGNPINPYETMNIVLNKGERVDFVLNANAKIGDYILRAESTCSSRIVGEGIIRYEGDDNDKMSDVDVVQEKATKEFNTGFNSIFCNDVDKVCLSDVHSLKKLPRVLRDRNVDKRIYFDFNSVLVPDLQEKGVYKRIHKINNITFMYPPSPILTQIHDVPEHVICNDVIFPEKCKNSHNCECTYIDNIPLDSTVEIIISNQDQDIAEHVFHLHGYHFYVVGTKEFKTATSLEKVKRLDETGELFTRNLINPVVKDTLRVPKFGAVAIRFIASNAGFWILRDEKSKMWTKGLDVVLRVGDAGDVPGPPANFPSCGSWVGPDFFLE